MSLFAFGFTRKDKNDKEGGEQGNSNQGDEKQVSSDVLMSETAKERYDGKRKLLALAVDSGKKGKMSSVGWHIMKWRER